MTRTKVLATIALIALAVLVAQGSFTGGKLKAAVDDMFDAALMIGIGHHEVHEGAAFAVEVLDLTLADGDSMCVAFKTIAGTKRAHMIFEFSTLVGAHVEVIEGPTWDAQTGTLAKIYNRLRVAAPDSSSLLENGSSASFAKTDSVVVNPESLAGGTTIHTVYSFGVKNFATASGRDVEEWVLKPDTQYAVCLVSDAATNEAHLILHWYEHTDRK